MISRLSVIIKSLIETVNLFLEGLILELFMNRAGMMSEREEEELKKMNNYSAHVPWILEERIFFWNSKLLFGSLSLPLFPLSIPLRHPNSLASMYFDETKMIFFIIHCSISPNHSLETS